MVTRAYARLGGLILLAAAAPVAAQLPLPQTPKQKAMSTVGLPQIVEQARQVGVEETKIRVILDSLQQRGVSANDAEMILRDEVEAVRAGAPQENFGAVVNAHLARGLRGRDLATAIRAEHARRGTGKPEHAGARGQAQGGKKKP